MEKIFNLIGSDSPRLASLSRSDATRRGTLRGSFRRKAYGTWRNSSNEIEYLVGSLRRSFTKMILSGAVIILVSGFMASCKAQSSDADGCFEIVSNSQAVSLFISPEDYPGVQRAMGDLQSDLRKISQNQVLFQSAGFPHGDRIVIAGTVGKSPEINALVESGKIDASFVKDEWEAYHIEVIENPFEGVEEALVIAGSDKRGTIYGIYEVSRQLGVSPWYFWADVPVPHKENVSVIPGCMLQDKPKVQYRGIFLNDENPALYGWVNETYGGFNHEFYSDVFELILRQKGNYMWTAMWGKAFYDDDPLNAETADLYGIVIGTSHHEPMGRAHVEWERYGKGAWNYQTNEEKLKEFWREGIERLGDYEATISLAMRGDGDEPMSEGANVALLQRIVEDQRKIIDDISPENKDRQVQLWALYKEVQEYYEKGMRAPDDVMLLLADDNWGNLRLLPKPGTAEEHPGGWGIYYHFDYVGGPRNYKWLNTNQISRTWEQMHLAWEHNVNRMWLVNVGDLKPMEYPISFFLDYAWNPEAMSVKEMEAYPAQWASDQFGEHYGEEIGDILTAYTRYNARRKHELLSPDTYSLVHFNEADRIVNEYNDLAEHAESIYDSISEEYKDAYYQLVLFPVLASANLNELYVSAAKNHWYAEQGRASTNEMADKVKELFAKDIELTDYYHHEMANGKWNHMMSQTHIGYTYWQQPEQNNMPEVETINLKSSAEMGVAIQGSENWWPHSNNKAALPVFDVFNRPSAYVDIFNRGKESFDYSIETDARWIQISNTQGTIDKQERVWVSVDWNQIPAGTQEATLRVTGTTGESVEIGVKVMNSSKEKVTGFVESNGYISMEAAHYSNKTDAGPAQWMEVPDVGRTLSGMMPSPVTAETREPGSENSPVLEYNVHLNTTGAVKVKVYTSPTLDYYMNNNGLKYGISFDDEDPAIINIHENMNWNQVVADYINITESEHVIKKAGNHVLKLWMADPGVVIQKIVIEAGDVGNTYLGPPESARAN